MYHLAEELVELIGNGKQVFVCFSPEILDFTKSGKVGSISIYVSGKKLDIAISDKNIIEVYSLLEASVFSKGFVLFAWGIKTFFSYIKFYTKKTFIPESTIIDIKVIEGFLGIKKRTPTSFTEAINRAKEIGKFSEWKELYKNILLPLIVKVVPNMETTPLLNTDLRTSVYAHYEIEGQSGGRLQASSVFDRGFNPHTMGKEVKNKLRPFGYEKLFMYFDFKQMEVWMLAYLSGDPSLKELLNSKKDFYKVVYGLITGNEKASEEARKYCKLIFLQVIYGMTPKSLAKQFQIAYTLAHSIHENLVNSFPVAFNWLDNRLKEIKDDIGRDFFGRPRNFAEKPYRIRNFSVQAPSATFCLEKLIGLHKDLKNLDSQVCFNIHDGYGILCNKNNFRETYAIAKKSLQSESELLQGLTVPVGCQMGFNLNKLKAVG